jgi:hypothetical protein
LPSESTDPLSKLELQLNQLSLSEETTNFGFEADRCSEDACEKSPVAGGGGSDVGPAWSVGSLGHRYGKCEPCAWYYDAKGCRQSFDCTFCHSCTRADRNMAIRRYKRRKRDAWAKRPGWGSAGAADVGHEGKLQHTPSLVLAAVPIAWYPCQGQTSLPCERSPW